MPDTETTLSWESFGTAFSALRERRGMTLSDVAEAMQERHGVTVTKAHLSKIGRDLDRPGTELIVRLADVFDVQPEYFLHYRLAVARARFSDRPPQTLHDASEALRDLEAGARARRH